LFGGIGYIWFVVFLKIENCNCYSKMKALRNKYSILIIFASLIFTSCRKHSSFEYQAKNLSDANIKIMFKTSNGTSSDQTLILGVGETISMYKEDLGAGRVGSSEKKGEYIGAFSKIEITKNNTLTGKKDFLKTASWDYEEMNPHFGIYTLKITNSDF